MIEEFAKKSRKNASNGLEVYSCLDMKHLARKLLKIFIFLA